MVLVSTPHKFVFLHVPKTAGSSITAALYDKVDNGTSIVPIDRFGWQHKYHVPGTYMHDDFSALKGRVDVPKDFLVFMVVRNPWSRLVSYYVATEKDGGLAGFSSWLDRAWGDDKFRRIMAPAKRWAHSIPKDYPRRFLRFEHLASEWKTLCEDLGFKVALPHRLKTERSLASWRHYYTEKTHDLVAEKFRDDILEYGYAFSDPIHL